AASVQRWFSDPGAACPGRRELANRSGRPGFGDVAGGPGARRRALLHHQTTRRRDGPRPLLDPFTAGATGRTARAGSSSFARYPRHPGPASKIPHSSTSRRERVWQIALAARWVLLQLALKWAAVDAQTPRGFGDISLAIGQDPLNVLPFGPRQGRRRRLLVRQRHRPGPISIKRAQDFIGVRGLG